MADLITTAFRIVKEATEGKATPTAQQESGRKGGLKGGKARAENLTGQQRSEIARKAALAGWSAD